VRPGHLLMSTRDRARRWFRRVTFCLAFGAALSLAVAFAAAKWGALRVTTTAGIGPSFQRPRGVELARRVAKRAAALRMGL
jgi:hypothetical protein